MSKLVLGAGLGGLSAAYYHLQRFPNVAIKIIESSNRVGGWIRSVNKGGAILEQGPRSIRPKGFAGANTLKLVEDLKLTKEIVPIPSDHPAALNRMIYARGKLHSLPSGVLGIFRKQPPFSKPFYKYLLNYVRKSKTFIPEGDESLYSFVQRRFGTDFADYAISPLVCGICAGDAKEISVRLIMESLFEKEQKDESILMGLLGDVFSGDSKRAIPKSSLYERVKTESWNIYTFKEGMETLPKALQREIFANEADIQFNSECAKLETNEHGVSLLLADGTRISADYVISSLPAFELGDLLIEQHPILGKLLKSIPFVTVAVVNLQYDTMLPLKEGFGFLVPPKEKLPVLGVIFDSCCFPQSSNTVCKTQLTVMMGGHWFEEYFGKECSDQYVLNTALKQIGDILNIKKDPVQYRISVLKDCIPQYIVGHRGRVNEIEGYIKRRDLPIYLCGNSYYGIGINDVILSAKNVVDKL